MVSIQDVAKFFINKSQTAGFPITHLKLQKLCYYAQAWNLTLSNDHNPLFRNEFQAWVHGPVNPDLYREFKHYGWNSIEKKYADVKFQPNELWILNEVWKVYGHLDAKFLETLTHNETPWLNARKGLPEGMPSERLINEGDMLDYYGSLIKKKPVHA
ncbi:Panacea domain-containing protein [Paenibacillus sp. NPDC056722]|uniref:Panacea domain-containing protein n=1 Tax=Paenibacillus sp. NPDC056722 TaxID=3345924 RepID=UPI00369817E5